MGSKNKNQKMDSMVTEFTLSSWWKTIIFSHDYHFLKNYRISAGIGIIKGRRALFLLESLGNRKD